MQAFLLPPTERLRNWKEFRDTLTVDLTDEEQLIKVATYWGTFPLLNHYTDPDDTESWNTPWETLYGNDFCSVTLAYMMFHTLLLSEDGRWVPERLELQYINSKELSDFLMIVVVDNKYVINFSQNEIINYELIQNNSIIQNRYKFIDNKFKSK